MTTDSKYTNVEILSYLWALEIAPLFWRDERTGVDTTAWCGHVPFAHWIIGAAEPRTLVELGTHKGVSYSAFCEAVARHKLDTKCYAVDTWKGDDQAGHYGEEVYDEFRGFHDKRYGWFSKLLRCTFDEALSYVSDGSVDLLHIDGLHSYEAVRHDFEEWHPKLSEKGVVLFHDTNVREGDFGVWRLWEELRTQFASFEFLHSHGLGVLAVGAAVTAPVAALCSLSDPKNVTAVRARFTFLGENSSLRSRCANLTRDLASAALRLKVTEEARVGAEGNAHQASLRVGAAEEAQAGAEERAHQASLRVRAAEEAQAGAEERAHQASLRVRAAEEAQAGAEERAHQASLLVKKAEEARKSAEEARMASEERARQAVLQRDQVIGSLTWRIAEPLHRLIRLFPLSMRTPVYNALASIPRLGSKARRHLTK